MQTPNTSSKHFLLLITTLFIASGQAAYAEKNTPQAEILHWWSSEGESAALSVFVDEFKSRGGHYYDSRNDNQIKNREEAVERMGKGYPATLTQWNAGKDVAELYDFGLIQSLNDKRLIDKITRLLPAPVLDSVTYKDKIIAIPLNIHSENWIWYSKSVLGSEYLDETGNLTKLLKLGKTLEDTGIPLLAIGDQRWQVRIFFTSVLLGVSRDTYKDFYLTSKPDVVERQEFKQALEIFSQLSHKAKSFGDGNWNTQVKAVADNLAGATFMGDWAKGEFVSMGRKAGEDYGCVLSSNEDPSLLMTIDTLLLGNVTDDAEISGQRLMLDVVSDAEVNLAFNKLKGSASPYMSATQIKEFGSNTGSTVDICSAQVYKRLQNQEALIPPYASYSFGDNDSAEQIDATIYELWQSSRNSDLHDTTPVTQALDKFRKIQNRKNSPPPITADISNQQ